MQPAAQTQQDIRDIIFAPISHRPYTAHVSTECAGVIAGTVRLVEHLSSLGVDVELMVADGADVAAATVVAKLTGTPKQLAMAEEVAVGLLAKPSGIATAARRAVELAGPEMRIVSGAWKKMPPEIKWVVRESVAAGGAAFRVSDKPFLYLDKNFVRMLGGVEATLAAVAGQGDKLKCIQLKGEFAAVADEALAAARGGADVLMIDTGRLADVEAANGALAGAGLRDRVEIAFAQGIRLEDIPYLRDKGIDILDIGVAIVDAPLLDMKFEVRGMAATCN
jgi:nicotinate-nucleotide pyrophosphorylase (carboxylating)